MKFLLVTLALLAFSVHASSAKQDLRAKLTDPIDQLFANTVTDKSPGCSVGLIKDNELVFDKSYGLANLEYNIPLTSKSVHRIASVSKQFTAFSVLLLAEDGLINLDDDIRKYLPDLNDYGVKVSIKAMLGHFSGMGDIGEQNELLSQSSLAMFRLGNEGFITAQDFYDVIKKLPLIQPPDQSQKYSNFAYFLLSILVEKVSGQSLREFADNRIFKPLGMKNTFFADDGEELIPNRASGYRSTNPGKYLNHYTYLFAVGDGGVFTTIEDMAIWDKHFYFPRLGKNPSELMKLMNFPNSQHGYEGDSRYLYANGQYIDTTYEHGNSYEHSGGWMGTATVYIRRPAVKTSAIVFCNNASLNASEFAFPILDIADNLF